MFVKFTKVFGYRDLEFFWNYLVEKGVFRSVFKEEIGAGIF